MRLTRISGRSIGTTSKFVNEFNSRLNASRSTVHYTVEESQLADRVREAISVQAARDYDVFLSYARLDGSQVASDLLKCLNDLNVTVWFDNASIRLGWSLALQMDQGLRRSRAGVVLLTPVYLGGRFWTERELGALLHKNTLIPVLHGVTIEQVAEYSGILPDLPSLSTGRDSVEEIAHKIAGAVLLAEHV